MNEFTAVAVVVVLLSMGWMESREPTAPQFKSAREAGTQLLFYTLCPHFSMWLYGWSGDPFGDYWTGYALAACSLILVYGLVSALAFVFVAARVIAK